MEEELLQVFDENKNIINESIKRSLKRTLQNGKHFMVVLLFIENEERFLIQKVSKEKGKVMAVTGGHVTFGDSGLTTVKKEAKEELNIELNDNELVLVDWIDYGNCFCDIYYTSKKVDTSNIKLQKEEVEEIFWLNKEEIERLIKQDKFRKTNIEPFYRILKYKEKLH